MLDVNIQGLDELIKKFEKAGGGEFRKQAGLYLEALGLEFLDIVQDEIIRLKIVESSRLLSSFNRGDSQNVFLYSSGGLELEVGTNMEYASYINDGYPTVTDKSAIDSPMFPGGMMRDGTLVRWVPGIWEGDKFTFDPESDTGMLLKERFIDGRPYWDNAAVIFNAIFEKSLDAKLQIWIDEFFG